MSAPELARKSYFTASPIHRFPTGAHFGTAGQSDFYDLTAVPEMQFNLMFLVVKTPDAYFLRVTPVGSLTVGEKSHLQDDPWCKGWFRREIYFEHGPKTDENNETRVIRLAAAPGTPNEQHQYTVRTQTGIQLGLDKDGPSVGLNAGRETTLQQVTSDFGVDKQLQGQMVGWSYFLRTAIDVWGNKHRVELTRSYDLKYESQLRHGWFDDKNGVLLGIPNIAWNALTLSTDAAVYFETIYRLPIPEEGDPYSVPWFFGCSQNLWALRSAVRLSGGTSRVLSVGGAVTLNVGHEGINFSGGGALQSNNKQDATDEDPQLYIPQTKAMTALDTLRDELFS
ncbi:MAG: hypothetical protein AAF184_14420 [Pseudomonadota bacterium]